MKKTLGILLLLTILSSAYDSVAKLKMSCDIGNKKACEQLYALEHPESSTPNTITQDMKHVPALQMQNSKNGIETKKIIVTGYGTSKDNALSNAYKTAIEQYVGVVIDSDTMMKNGKLIKDKILTASNGFIQSYKEISVDENDGLFEVKIEAIVKSQKLYKKIKNLHIKTLTVYNAGDAATRMNNEPVAKSKENDYIVPGINTAPVSVSTMNKSKADVENIMRKTVGDFFSSKSIKEMLVAEVSSMKIDEDNADNADNADNGSVPVKIYYTLSINNKIYNQKIKQLETVFENLGGEYHKRVDLPTHKYRRTVEPNKYFIKNKERVENLKVTNIGIFKKYGKGYKLDTWEFPTIWKDIYPFNIDSTIKLQKKIQMTLLFKDKNNKVIQATSIVPKRKGGYGYKISYILLTGILPNQIYSYYGKNSNIEDSLKIIAPTLMSNSSTASSIPMYSQVDCSYTQNMDINDIQSVKYVSVELQEI